MRPYQVSRKAATPVLAPGASPGVSFIWLGYEGQTTFRAEDAA